MLAFLLTLIGGSAGYQISTTPLKFNDAVSYCQNTYGSSIATVYTPEQNTIVSQLCNTGKIGNCWIGLIENKWIKSNVTVGFENWNTSGPINNVQQRCTEITELGIWNHIECAEYRLPICDNHPNTGS